MKMTRRQLREVINEVMKIHFRPGISDEEKQKLLRGLFDLLDTGDGDK